jgi:hypothetical protein
MFRAAIVGGGWDARDPDGRRLPTPRVIRIALGFARVAADYRRRYGVPGPAGDPAAIPGGCSATPASGCGVAVGARRVSVTPLRAQRPRRAWGMVAG